MFAYCGNNPIVFADYNGEWFTLVIGAVIGAGTSALATWIDGGDPEEVAVSAFCGAIAGIFGASGAGGIVGQMVAGAVSSAIDSGIRNYNDYVSGEKTLQEAVTSTIIDTALGATMSAVGYTGNTIKVTEPISDAAVDGLVTLTRFGVHPSTRAAAKTAVKAGKKLIKKAVKEILVDDSITTVASMGISRLLEVFY